MPRLLPTGFFAFLYPLCATLNAPIFSFIFPTPLPFRAINTRCFPTETNFSPVRRSSTSFTATLQMIAPAFFSAASSSRPSNLLPFAQCAISFSTFLPAYYPRQDTKSSSKRSRCRLIAKYDLTTVVGATRPINGARSALQVVSPRGGGRSFTKRLVPSPISSQSIN